MNRQAMRNISIRKEKKDDIAAIGKVILAAFKNHPHSNQTGHLLVEKLRETGALSVSPVAESEGEIVDRRLLDALTG